MLKLKVKESPDVIKSSIKGKNYSMLECIVMLDTSITMLRKDFKLSNEEIKDLFNEYKVNLKEKSND